jgi:hypothetical protein
MHDQGPTKVLDMAKNSMSMKQHIRESIHASNKAIYDMHVSLCLTFCVHVSSVLHPYCLNALLLYQSAWLRETCTSMVDTNTHEQVNQKLMRKNSQASAHSSWR